MDSQTVHLIATDPPFNKGKDFHATPESLASGASFQDRWSWEDDINDEWVDQIEDDHPHVMRVIEGSRASYGDDMGAFLCFMGVRLLEMKRVLRDDGSIYLHCDPTASHYIKELMDAVFGYKNFRNEIVWVYGLGGSSKKMWSKKHDIILFYTKSKEYYFDKPTIPATSAMMTGKQKGMLDVWTDIPSLNNMAKERTGYPTQKPLALYERIIKASSRVGEIVLDPFCGCATTPIAAERLGRDWVGIDIWDKTYEMVIERLKDEGLFQEEGKDVSGSHKGGVLTMGRIHLETKPPKRTDDGLYAAPFLKPKVVLKEPEGPTMSRLKMYEVLLSYDGIRCQGCDRSFEHKNYLELDHNTPRSDGGINHISNRILLCSPCNRKKSNTLTLSGLRKENQKDGFMAQANS